MFHIEQQTTTIESRVSQIGIIINYIFRKQNHHQLITRNKYSVYLSDPVDFQLSTDEDDFVIEN